MALNVDQVIFSPKRRVDIHGLLVSFDQFLQPGEIIESGLFQVFMFSGEDPDPSHIIQGGIDVRGKNLYQKVKQGISGNIYQLFFTALTDQENTYTVQAVLAILPDDIPPGPIYQYVYFTTPPYPLNTLEGIGSTSLTVGGYEWMPPRDAITSLSDVVSGEIRVILLSVTNQLPEGVTSESGIVEGTLRAILLTYAGPPEGIDSSSDIVSGNIRIILISYTNWPEEGITSVSSIVSGTLT